MRRRSWPALPAVIGMFVGLLAALGTASPALADDYDVIDFATCLSGAVGNPGWAGVGSTPYENEVSCGPAITPTGGGSVELRRYDRATVSGATGDGWLSQVQMRVYYEGGTDGFRLCIKGVPASASIATASGRYNASSGWFTYGFTAAGPAVSDMGGHGLLYQETAADVGSGWEYAYVAPNDGGSDSSWSTPGGKCDVGDPGPPSLPAPVPMPELSCFRGHLGEGGQPTEFGAAVANPDPDATDTFSWLLPGDTDWRSGPVASWVVPSDLSAMPPGGWKAKCKVERIITNPSRPGDGRWSDAEATTDAYDCDPTDIDCLSVVAGPLAAAAASAVPWYITSSGRNVLTQSPLPPVPIDAGPGDVSRFPDLADWLAKEKATKPPTPSLWGRVKSVGASVAGVAGSGVVGWLAGGVASTVLDGVLPMDQGWLCAYNPGYEILNGDVCSAFNTDPATRSQIQVLDSGGDPVSRAEATEWTTTVAMAEVVVNPTRPLVGTHTEVVPADPTVKPEGGERLTETQAEDLAEEAENPEVPGPDGGDCPSGLSILAPWKYMQVMKCVLTWAFVPTGLSLDGLALECETAFPCNAGIEAVGTVTAIVDGFGSGLDGEKCGPTVGFSAVGEFDGFEVELPSDAEGCVHAGTDGATLLGKRTLIRTAAAVFLWVAFLVRCYRFLPWAKDEDVPGAGL